MIIRSYFHNGPGSAYGLVARPGYYSSQMLQPVGALLEAAAAARRDRTTPYEQVITAGSIPLR
jgi:hypothetical protein